MDSSGWLEYLADGPNAGFFAEPLKDSDALVVSAVNVYEVFRRVAAQCGEHAGLQAVSVMQEARLLPVDLPTSLLAARLSLSLRLPMADSLILATARSAGAVLWTQDADFDGIEEVRYVAARAP